MISSIVVGLEADVQPEPGPLELYQLAFPHRTVEWDRSRQLWVVMQDNPVMGIRERYEIIYDYESPCDGDGLPIGGEDLERLLRAKDPSVTRRYRPFDYEFVRGRRRMRFEFLHAGSLKYAERVAREEERVARTIIRTNASEAAAAWGEIRRYLPCAAGDTKIPLVPGGFTTRAQDRLAQKAS